MEKNQEEIDEKMIKVFRNVCEMHKVFLEKAGQLSPMIITINKNNTLSIIILKFKDDNEKELMRQGMKQKLVDMKISGYIFVADSWMSNYNAVTNTKSDRKEAIVSILFTPRKEIFHLIIHEGKNIISEKTIEENEKEYGQTYSGWNIWGRH